MSLQELISLATSEGIKVAWIKATHKLSQSFSFLMILSNPRLVVVQSLSRVWLFVIPWTTAHQPSLSFTTSQNLLKLMSIDSMMLSNYLILCHPLLLLPSIFPNIRVFSNESDLLIKWPKYWSFSISTSKEYPGLISFRIDWFDLLVVQGAFRYFNMSVPPSRVFWFGKKKNPMILSRFWTLSY